MLNSKLIINLLNPLILYSINLITIKIRINIFILNREYIRLKKDVLSNIYLILNQ